MTAKEIIRKAGYKISKGIGSEWEFFVSDGTYAITCYETPNKFEAYSSDEMLDDKYETVDKTEQEILRALKDAFQAEQNFIANGRKSIREYQLQHAEWN